MASAFRCSDSKNGDYFTSCDIYTCLNRTRCLQDPKNKEAFLNHINSLKQKITKLDNKITQLEKDNKTLNDNISDCYYYLYQDEMELPPTARMLNILHCARARRIYLL